jgi:hypothetical protein
VGRGLVGEEVGDHVAAVQLGDDVGGVPHQAHAERLALRLRLEHQLQSFVQVAGQAVAVAGVHAALDPGLVDLHPQEGAAVHGGGQGLRAAHAAQARGHHQAPGEVAAEVLAGRLGERLVGALQDALRADVDPRAGGHLPVHGESQRLQAAELVPGGPARHQVGVGDEHARRLLVRAEHAHRLPALHQHRLVVLQAAQGVDDGVVAVPVARRLARPAVDDELLGLLGHLGIEVVHEHPEGGLLVPALAGELGAARGADRLGCGGGRHECLQPLVESRGSPPRHIVDPPGVTGQRARW